jgi:alkylation response protein AidB-like acyl-CoA dehydrogenase
MIPVQYLEALALERALGDPSLPENTLSFRRAMALDEADAFPEAEISFLHMLGVPRVYVPQELGGLFSSAETFLALGRVLARRNMSVAVSYSTMLWSTLSWIGGNDEQKQRVADWVMRHGQFPCLAYSEAEHGADLSSNGLTAQRNDDGSYTLRGEKWPINRATRSGFLVLLARTDGGQHLRNHTLFIVNKNTLDSQRYYHLPRVKTHGLRGCDISGIGFRQCTIPAEARVGSEGHGLELALKGFQLTRTFCTALSLGVGDSVLRLVADFAASRQLYGAAVRTLPLTRDVLANAYVSQLLAECMAMVAARGLHLYPKQFSSWSSVSKVHVTHLVDFAGQQLSAILGARYYMREQHGEGMFQKFMRDGAIVSVFDGSSHVCLDSLATLLPAMVRRRQKSQPADAAALYDLHHQLDAMPFDQLDLFGRGGDAVLDSLPGLVEQLAAVQPDEQRSPALLASLRALTAQLQQELAALDAAILDEPQRPGERNSARRFDFAQRYCAVHGATSALGLWLYNRSALGAFFGGGAWLEAILVRGGASEFRSNQLSPQLAETLQRQLDHQHQHQHMFSLLPWPLASGGLPETSAPEFYKETYDEPAIA